MVRVKHKSTVNINNNKSNKNNNKNLQTTRFTYDLIKLFCLSNPRWFEEKCVIFCNLIPLTTHLRHKIVVGILKTS